MRFVGAMSISSGAKSRLRRALIPAAMKMRPRRAGVRVIPLGDGVIRELKDWRERTKFKGQDDLVFPNRHGDFYDHRGMVKLKFDPLFVALQKKWLEERYNEPLETFPWHALRPILSWINAGLPPKAVQTFAGHSSLQVTMDRYGHLFRSDDHGRAMDSISNSLFAEHQHDRRLCAVSIRSYLQEHPNSEVGLYRRGK